MNGVFLDRGADRSWSVEESIDGRRREEAAELLEDPFPTPHSEEPVVHEAHTEAGHVGPPHGVFTLAHAAH